MSSKELRELYFYYKLSKLIYSGHASGRVRCDNLFKRYNFIL